MNYILKKDVTASLKAVGNHSKSTPAVIKVGLDVHATLYVAAVQEDHATPKPPTRHSPDGFLLWVGKQLMAGHSVHVVYESGCFGFGLFRELEKMGARCYVITPLDLDERRTRVKTNETDAMALCLRLGRYLDGNKKELAVIRVPSEKEEQARHEHRIRQQLVRERKRLQAEGRSLLMLHRQPDIANWWRKSGWSTLGRLLPAWLLEALECFRKLLTLLDEQIAALSEKIEVAAPQTLPLGLGKMTAVILNREVCDWARFKNRRQPGNYAGLCPSEDSTGTKRTQGSITRVGNPRIRAALVEAAWRLVRYQSAYPPIEKRSKILARGAKATSGERKKAVVAVARQLMVDLWKWNTGRATLEQLGLKAAPAPKAAA